MAMSYVIYIGALLVCWILARWASLSNKKICVWAIVILLSLVGGLRAYSVGIDTIVYADRFDLIRLGHLDLAYGFEESFKLICYFLSNVFQHTSALFLIFAGITHFCVVWRFWDLRNVSAFSTAVACYYMGSFFFTLNTMRQFCAVAIIFYFTRYLVKHQYIRYLLGVLVASLFHQSAVIGIALVAFGFLRWKELTRSQKLFFFGMLIASPLVLLYVLARIERYTGYLELIQPDIGIMVPIKMLFYLTSIWLVFRIYRRESYFANWNGFAIADKNSVILGCIGYAIGLVLLFSSYFLPIMNRVGWYFTIYEGFYMGMLMRAMYKPHRYALGFFVILITGYGFFAAMTGNAQGHMPYLFVWQA